MSRLKCIVNPMPDRIHRSARPARLPSDTRIMISPPDGRAASASRENSSKIGCESIGSFEVMDLARTIKEYSIMVVIALELLALGLGLLVADKILAFEFAKWRYRDIT